MKKVINLKCGKKKKKKKAHCSTDFSKCFYLKKKKKLSVT